MLGTINQKTTAPFLVRPIEAHLPREMLSILVIDGCRTSLLMSFLLETKLASFFVLGLLFLACSKIDDILG